ncbi:MAG: transposase [Solobacterium sp.]|nr:transposase [Solobacterium sp.]
MAIYPVCPHCGSKQTSRVENFYRCSECRKDFGREPYTDNGEKMTDAVKGLRFRFGDLISGSVRLRMAEDLDSCLWEVYDTNGGDLDKVADVMNSEEWQAFKNTLLHDLYYYDWAKEYIPVNDGREIRGNNEWETAVIVSENEEYICRGYDAYPVYWDKFMSLLDPFFNRLQRD